MRLPSVTHLTDQGRRTLLRFPWTIAAGLFTAFCAIEVAHGQNDDVWARAAFVAALALPLTIALTLTAEERTWDPLRRTGSILVGVALLVLFFRSWAGLDHQPDTLRYLSLSAALHLTVAFLPFVGVQGDVGFWQYNRRLLLGLLRSVLFSAVIFIALAIALGALDKLFGVTVDNKAYIDIWFVVLFVVNTWIFLAAIPTALAALAQDEEYPRALKIFAQYILTPIAFGYLLILLAYLVKLLMGGEWPNGWIGWLVASVAVSGILGYLLVEPLRHHADEGWIRIYARWLFLGLIPAALMLLTAFWKRIEPYGLTEPRTLGLLLGLWLLGTALLFSLRPGASIKTIPVSLAALFLVTLYGPVSLASLSIGSQGRRMERMIQSPANQDSAKEASEALRFLLDHQAGDEIAARIAKPLPVVDWSTVPRYGPARDSQAKNLLALAGVTYTRQRTRGNLENFALTQEEGRASDISGFTWLVPLNSNDHGRHAVGRDTVQALDIENRSTARIILGTDTLQFELRALVRREADSVVIASRTDSAIRLRPAGSTRHAELVLRQFNGTGVGDSMRVYYWGGSLLLR